MDLDFDKIVEQIQSKEAVETELKQCGQLPIDGPGPDGWTPGRVAAILCNPIYAGVGPFPSMVNDATWIKSARVSIEQLGPELFFRIMLDSIRQSFNSL